MSFSLARRPHIPDFGRFKPHSPGWGQAFEFACLGIEADMNLVFESRWGRDFQGGRGILVDVQLALARATEAEHGHGVRFASPTLRLRWGQMQPVVAARISKHLTPTPETNEHPHHRCCTTSCCISGKHACYNLFSRCG